MKTIDRLQALRAGVRGLFAPVSLGVQAIATDDAGRVILVKHTYRAGWYLPGGGVARGETAEHAVLRELKEEIGLLRSAAPNLFGFYLRRAGAHSDYIAVYTVPGATANFRANIEIADIAFADPAAPPAGTSEGTQRRLAEFTGRANRSGEW